MGDGYTWDEGINISHKTKKGNHQLKDAACDHCRTAMRQKSTVPEGEKGISRGRTERYRCYRPCVRGRKKKCTKVDSTRREGKRERNTEEDETLERDSHVQHNVKKLA